MQVLDIEEKKHLLIILDKNFNYNKKTLRKLDINSSNQIKDEMKALFILEWILRCDFSPT